MVAISNGHCTVYVLLSGQRQVEKYVEIADKMRGSPLEANVETQRADIVTRFKNTLAAATEVREKMESMASAHRDFQSGVEKAKAWMDDSFEKIRQNSYSSGKNKEDLKVIQARSLLSSCHKANTKDIFSGTVASHSGAN